MQVFEVLADPVRKEIVEMLADDERTAGEIAERFAISRPAVSRHLRVLRESGLARVRVDAQRRVYALNPAPLREAGAWIELLRRRFEARDVRRRRRRHDRRVATPFASACRRFRPDQLGADIQRRRTEPS